MGINPETGLVEIKAFVVLSDDSLIDIFENKIKKDLKNNIEYYLVEPQERKVVKKSYSDNFLKNN